MSISELLEGQRSTKGLGTPLEKDGIRFPHNTTDAEVEVDFHILCRHILTKIQQDVSKAIEQGKSFTIPRSVKRWGRLHSINATALLLSRAANLQQKRCFLDRYSGLSLSEALLEDLERIYANGHSGPGIYQLLAKARNVDGSNPFLSGAGPRVDRRTVKTYTGSSVQSGANRKRSRSRRIKDHGTKGDEGNLSGSTLVPRVEGSASPFAGLFATEEAWLPSSVLGQPAS